MLYNKDLRNHANACNQRIIKYEMNLVQNLPTLFGLLCKMKRELTG